MSDTYQHQQIEAMAQAYWDEQQSFKAVEELGKEKFYCLSMLPYPSGNLHMGHVRNYTLGDVIARYQRMLGKNVLQPMGWDSFGLPAENAALKNKVAPHKWTVTNIEHMRTRFKSLGFAFDWHRELSTCEPDYYRWEQWLFTQLFKKGLAYKKNSIVNWDPVDHTVLANEQVVDGCGWRSGVPIEHREISQWFLKITDYAEELLQGLDDLDGWPDQVRTMQRNWIGRSDGVNISFAVEDQDLTLDIFTTRPETLYGVSYMAIAAEHPLAQQAAKQNKDIADFIEQCKHVKVAEAEIATLEKKGIQTPFYAINPLSKQKMPIWIANFVLMSYGTGAVMSVPAHDQRDFEFAQKYDLQLLPVIKPHDDELALPLQSAFNDPGVIINSGPYDGLNSSDAIGKITDDLEKQKLGTRVRHYRLRDWGVSRQRYWGTPIPIINCDKCGAVPVPEDQLPVLLPQDIKLEKPGSPLKSMPEFYQTTCPECQGEATRETDTFDTFFESSWYYARYTCFDQDNAMLDDRAKYWTPVDQYVGGVEHAVMHLLYARFFHKLLRDHGLVNSDEPFTRLLTQGMVIKDGAKMSKSKGNVVDPSELIEKYGADTVRLFSMFAAPPEQSLEWSDHGVAGSYRFLNRLFALAGTQSFLPEYNAAKPKVDWKKAPAALCEMRREIHQSLKQAVFDYQRYQFNTVVSAAMKLLKTLEKINSDDDFSRALMHEGLSILLRLLAPISPHVTHHLWQTLGYGDAIIDAAFPVVIEEALTTDSVQLIVQVGGKLRAKIEVPADATQESIEQTAKADENIQQFITGKTLLKTIYVAGRLINFVVK